MKNCVKNRKGITLIALVITIIVLLILSGVVISSISNGVIKKAQKATIQSELKSFEEKIELYKTNKFMEEKEFDSSSFYADESELRYNTKNEDERGNIYTIIPEAEKKYKGKICVEKGKMIFYSDDEEELKWAEAIGIATTGILIDKDGTLLCVDEVSTLIDKEGTLRIPERVKKISAGAFNGIDIDVKKVVIPGTCKEIGDSAFEGQKIEEVIIEEGVETLGKNVFKSCRSLKNVQLANSINKMGKNTFFQCTSLMNVNFPTNMKEIPNSTFYYCLALTMFEIPDSIEIINNEAFSSCKNLENLIISKQVIEIGAGAFKNCKKLTLTIAEDNQNYKIIENTLVTKDGTEIIYICQGEKLTEYNIPEGVTKIGSIFSTYKNIEKISIPESLTEISSSSDLMYIKSIDVDEDNQNFSTDGESLYNKEQTILVRYYGQDESYIVKENVIKLKRQSFSYKSMKEVVLPESLLSIEALTFDQAKIEKLYIGKNVNSLSGYSLYSMHSSTITLDPGNQYYKLEDRMLFNFEKTILMDVLKDEENIIIPDGVKKISGGAFHNNSKLKNVIIPNSVEEIGESFNYCNALEKIEIPSSVKSINTSCFNNTSIKEIIVHNTEGSISGATWGASAGIKIVKWVGKD